MNTWNHLVGGDAAETGSGPGSYDIRQSVWHVNCCSPVVAGGGGWGIFNAILGWTNSATYGSVISYNLYWLAAIICFCYMRHKERHGHLRVFQPLLRFRWKRPDDSETVEAVPKENESTGIFMKQKAPDDRAPQLNISGI